MVFLYISGLTVELLCQSIHGKWGQAKGDASDEAPPMDYVRILMEIIYLPSAAGTSGLEAAAGGARAAVACAARYRAGITVAVTVERTRIWTAVDELYGAHRRCSVGEVYDTHTARKL